MSGGQTGVDRAALDVAIALGFEHGGWCPSGRLAEDGAIPSRYVLKETDASDYSVRTELNVVDSDGTLILHTGVLQGGTNLTRRLARRHRKPLLLVELGTAPPPSEVCDWLKRQNVRVLNVAGPRESSSPGIGEIAFRYLLQVLTFPATH